MLINKEEGEETWKDTINNIWNRKRKKEIFKMEKNPKYYILRIWRLREDERNF